jgi:exodeoxyribonuclease VII large subunit
MEAVRALDADAEVAVIVIARGGGSLEDLLPFSDEGLIRTVFGCRTPVVSAIGHESDNPILDLVADVRASTPTDAAKRVVPDVADELGRLSQSLGALRRAMLGIIALQQDRLAALRSRPVLAEPTASFTVRYDQLESLRQRGQRATAARLDGEQLAVAHQLARIRAMSPKATLERGYAILVDPTGRAVTSAKQVAVGADLTAKLVDGELDTLVRAVRARADERLQSREEGQDR